MGYVDGLSGLSGLAATVQSDIPNDFATPEQRYGGTVDPAHSDIGEQSKPYSWESLAMPGATHGPYGLENQLIDDPAQFTFFDAGSPMDDPLFDWNSPTNTRSHAAVHHRVEVDAPNQYDAIMDQIEQSNDAHGQNDGTSRHMTMDQLGYAQQDNWQEIWEINPGETLLEEIPMQAKSALPMGGFGNTDRTASQAHQNQYGFDSKHQHRRYTQVSLGHLPGNFMWLTPKGRPIHRNLPGPSRPPIGLDSQFTGDNLGAAFEYHTGAILQATPEAYVPPPTPNINTATPTYGNPMGTDGFEMW